MLDTFRPLIEAARDLDLSDPEAARAELDRRLDPESAEGRAVAANLEQLLAEGAICDRGEPPVRWSRAAKPGEASAGFSIDTVRMNGPGPRHVHPKGEVNFCVPLEGAPTFEGSPRGWVVMPPGSEHVPAVEGGEMLIVYLLPEGAMEFVK